MIRWGDAMSKYDLIKEKVESVRKQNGGINLTNSDMLIYLLEKMDSLPCISHERVISRNNAILGILTMLVVGICVKLFVFV